MSTATRTDEKAATMLDLINKVEPEIVCQIGRVHSVLYAISELAHLNETDQARWLRHRDGIACIGEAGMQLADRLYHEVDRSFLELRNALGAVDLPDQKAGEE